MISDPRWLEILKASGWQTAALFLACATFLLAAHLGWLPPLASLVTLSVTFAMLLTGR